jgi:hypothetical protein
MSKRSLLTLSQHRLPIQARDRRFVNVIGDAAETPAPGACTRISWTHSRNMTCNTYDLRIILVQWTSTGLPTSEDGLIGSKNVRGTATPARGQP